MKQILLFLSILLSSLFSAHAEQMYVGYCDGKIGSDAMGFSGKNATIAEAVFLRPSELSALSAGSITAIHAGLLENANAYPEKLTVWVRSELSGENIASGEGNAQGGWNLISLNSSVALSNYVETGLWIGFSFLQESTKLNVITFTDNALGLTDCGWVSKNGNWSNKSASNGVLPIEALVEGDLPQHNLSILSATATPDVVKLGDKMRFELTIRNNALQTAQKPVISYNIGNGAITGNYIVQSNLSIRQQTTVAINVASSAITEEGEYKAQFELQWADGSTDEDATDNTAEVTLTLAKNVFYRNMLVEEGTGSWCGWCVRGIVGLREMREKYPDRFIGIGVHNSDVYTVSNYDSWMSTKISGYPSALFNRDGSVYDPNFEEIENAFNSMNSVAEGGISVSANLNNSQLTFNSSTAFSKSMTGKSYKVAYVVVEDKLPITQKNYYAGGGYGAMGGFENMGSVTQIEIDDVARGIYPSPNGTSLNLPEQIVKDETYSHQLEVTMPTIANLDNVFVVAILIDGSTGEIVNAAKGAISQGESGLEQVEDTHETGVAYNLYGQPLQRPGKGLILIDGKKKLVR